MAHSLASGRAPRDALALVGVDVRAIWEEEDETKNNLKRII